ncbi:MAG: TolC family protein [Bacteroidota bacterium]
MRILLFLSLFLSLCASGMAQKKLSLSEAIRIGLRNNFQIQIAERERDIAQNDNTFKNTSRYPRIDFNFYLQNNVNRQTPVVSFLQESFTSTNNVPIASIDLDYTLMDGHRARIDKSRYEELLEQSEGTIALRIEAAIYSIIRSYYQGLLEKEQLRVFQEVLNLSRDRVAFQKIRKEYGQASDFDILQAQDAYLNDSTNYILQSNTYDNALRNLKLAIGEKDINKVYELSDPLKYQAKNYQYTDLKRKMQSSNKELLNLQTARNISRIEKEYQESFRRPTLNLSSGIAQRFDLSYSNAINPFDDNGDIYGFASGNNTNFYLNFTFNYPLFDAGVARRRIENAQIGETIAELNINELQRNLNTQLKNTLETYNNRRKLVKITEDLIENARQNLQIAEERFRAGQINNFDFRTIQLSFINASQTKLSAIYNVLITETELVRLIGGLVRN